MDDGSLGWLVNDDVDKANCKVQVQEENNTPSLYFISLRDIQPGEEILYNYGHGDYPWRTKVLLFTAIYLEAHGCCPSEM